MRVVHNFLTLNSSYFSVLGPGNMCENIRKKSSQSMLLPRTDQMSTEVKVRLWTINSISMFIVKIWIGPFLLWQIQLKNTDRPLSKRAEKSQEDIYIYKIADTVLIMHAINSYIPVGYICAIVSYK